MSQKSVTVLSAPSCVQCKATYRALDDTDVLYAKDDARTDENRAIYAPLGHLKAPVVLVRDEDGNVLDSWSGFRPDKIDEIKADSAVPRIEAPELLAAA